jgi:Flp pilus assembly protein TadG
MSVARFPHDTRRRARRANERGSVLVLVAAGMVVFIGFAALAVDVGVLYTAQTQARRAADSGALAGAGRLITAPEEPDSAKAEAERFTEKHEIIGEPIDIDRAADIAVEGDSLVRVFVRRTEARANPLATYFARVLGIVDADMTVHAAAKVARGKDVEQCLWPFVPPDAWIESDGTRSSDSVFVDFEDAPVYDGGDSYNPPPTLGAGYPEFTGWGAKLSDQGRYLISKPGKPGNFASPGWWYPMNTPPNTQAGGMNQLREAIRGTCPKPYTLAQGDDAYLQTGFGGNAIHKALEESLTWEPSSPDEAKDCYGNPSSCADMRRIRTMPLYDPRAPLGPGASSPATVGNFAVVWLAGFCDAAPQSSSPQCAALEGKEKENTFAVMYLGPTTGYAAGDGESSSGVLAVRLVE